MNENYEGIWCCIIGRSFVANVSHEPGYFLRVSNEENHYIVYRLKVDKEVPLEKEKEEEEYENY